MKHRNVLAAAAAFGFLVCGASLAAADGKSACSEGGACKLSEGIPAVWHKGEVDGAAVYRSGKSAVILFTTTSKEPSLFEIAICGADNVQTTKLDDKGKAIDQKVTSPKGKFNNCDLFEFKTKLGQDGLIVEPKGKTFKFYAKRNGQASGFSLYVADQILPAREDAYHFMTDSK